MAKLFTSAGVPIGHEMFFGQPGHGFYPPGAVGDSSWMAVPFIHNFYDGHNGIKIIHILRDPLKVVSSMYQGRHLHDKTMETSEYSMFQKKRLPSMMRYRGLDRYLHFYLVWNYEIVPFAYKQYRLEDVIKDPKDMFHDLDINVQGKELYTRKYNERENPKYFTVNDLHRCDRKLKKEFLTFAKNYGYTYS